MIAAVGEFRTVKRKFWVAPRHDSDVVHFFERIVELQKSYDFAKLPIEACKLDGKKPLDWAFAPLADFLRKRVDAQIEFGLSLGNKPPTKFIFPPLAHRLDLASAIRSSARIAISRAIS